MGDQKQTVIIETEIDVDESIESINKLRAANKELTAERNKLNIATEEGRKRAAEINVQIDANTNKIKANSSSLEKQRFNVGNYTASIVEASKQIKALEEENKRMAVAIRTVDKSTEEGKQQFNELNQAIQNNITQINVYNQTIDKTTTSGQKAAASFKQLAPGLSSAAQGFMGMTRAALAFIATPIGAILAVISVAVAGAVAYFKQFEVVLDFIEDNVTKVTAVFGSLIQNLDKVASIIGNVLIGNFSKAAEQTRNLGQTMGDAATEAQRLLDMTRELEDAELKYRIESAAAANQMKAWVVASKNRNLSVEESNVLLQKASDLENELTDKAVKNAQKRADIEEGKLIASKKAQLEAANLLREAGEAQSEYINRLIESGLFSPEQLEPLISAYEKVEQEASAGLAFQEKIANQQAAMAEKEAARLEKLVELRKKQNDELQKELELQKKAADQQEKEVLQSQIDLLQKQIQAEQELQKLRLEARPDGLSKELAQLDLALQERISKLKGTEAQITEQTLLLEEQRNQAVIGIREKYRQEDLQKAKANREKQTSNAKKEAELEVEIERQKVAAIGNLSGSLSQFFEEETAAFKILASAQAVINTWLAATAALASDSSKSGIFGILSAAAVVANGLAAVAKINGVEFAEGGYTGPGPKHKPAGTVHAGEVVWSQEDVKQVGGPAIANAMRPTAKRMHAPSYGRYADGGVVTTGISQPINQQLELLNIVKNLPPSEVSVKQITKVQRQVKVKEQISKR